MATIAADTAAARELEVAFARDMRLAFAADAALAVDTAAAVPAAVTGLGDFRWLPGEIRRVGLTHAGLNSITVALGVTSLVAPGAAGARADVP